MRVNFSKWKLMRLTHDRSPFGFWYYRLCNKTNDLILNLTPENVTQHSRIE